MSMPRNFNKKTVGGRWELPPDGHQKFKQLALLDHCNLCEYATKILDDYVKENAHRIPEPTQTREISDADYAEFLAFKAFRARADHDRKDTNPGASPVPLPQLPTKSPYPAQVKTK